ncbi:low affinity iron permease family protein [Phenylobacterium sp.]|uniref:low affinity iron permease family protein n=1 Tax=Phenylobacterium sp. TaxID=1871053 RepID=UPI002736989F|nr:low affinity iron permease family protein [Phenylobacterium sp.]MDP3854177.1 low affinity iron permease family protein [Phenylobacterium sp.]
MTHSILHQGLDASGRVFTHPVSLLAMALFVGAWAVFERETLDWHAAATLITFAMAVVIERNARRDTTALQAKLDELIHATEGARNEIAAVENQSIEEIEARRR